MFHDIVPLAGMATGIIIIGTVFFGLVRMSKNQLLASQHKAGNLRELEHEMDELRQQVMGLEEDLREAHERIDFTERLLATRPENTRADVVAPDFDTTGGV